MRMPTLIATAGLLAVLGLAACGDDDDAAVEPAPPPAEVESPIPVHDAHVTIERSTFGESVPVPAGEEVLVANLDGIAHTFTEVDGLWDTGPIAPGEAAAVVVEEPGEYDFVCTIHPTMTGTITITSAADGTDGDATDG